MSDFLIGSQALGGQKLGELLLTTVHPASTTMPRTQQGFQQHLLNK